MSKLSEQLKELREEGGYNQSTLAKAMNTPRAKISLYENGKSVPDFKYLVTFIEFFNCSADFLIGLTDYPNREIVYKSVQPFNIRLRELLNQKGKSQKSLHETKHFSWNTIHDWLTAASLPSIESLKKLADFLDCSVDYILGRTDYEN